VGVKAVPVAAGRDPVPDVPAPDVPVLDVPVPDVPTPDVPVPDELVPDELVPDELVPDEPEVGPALSLAEAGLPAPPSALSPGLLGVLHAAVTGSAVVTGSAAVTATLLDLAVRGHLRIEEVAGPHKPADWSLVPAERAACDPLLPHEEALLSAVLGGRSSARSAPSAKRRTRDVDEQRIATKIHADRDTIARVLEPDKAGLSGEPPARTATTERTKTCTTSTLNAAPQPWPYFHQARRSASFVPFGRV
jgi:hypothetical protein